MFLKQLASGLLLVTGPYTFNGCPLRRINQRYAIATTTRLDVSKVKIPEHIKDEYFKRQREKGAKKSAETGLFETKKQVRFSSRFVFRKISSSISGGFLF